MNVRVGTGPVSWGVWFPDDPKQPPCHRFLDEAVEAGYEWIELGPYGYFPTDPDALKRELDARGLGVSGMFIMTHLETIGREELEAEVDRTCELLSQLGAGFVVLIDDVYRDLTTGEDIAPAVLDDEFWNRLIESAHNVAERAKTCWGLRTVFHPHVDTHVEYEDQIERLLGDTDPELISLCHDLGHHAYNGGDSIAFLRKHQDRIAYLHLKSVDRDLQLKVQRDGLPFVRAVELGVFAEPAEGVVDFAACREVLDDVGFEGFAVVEQDMYPAPLDKPLPIATRTRAYLREIGIG